MKPTNHFFLSILITITTVISSHAGNDTASSQDLEFVANDSINVEHKAAKPLINPRKDFKKIQFAAQIGADVIWLNYEKPMKEWHLFPWIGYSAAALVNFNMVPAFTIETGLRLSKTGNKLRADINLKNTVITVPFIDTAHIDSSRIITGYATQNIYSLSIPLNFILNIPYSPVFLFAGFDMAYILYANGIVDYLSSNIRDTDENTTNVLNRLNTSLLCGAGYKWNAFSKCLAVRLDIRIGVTDMAKKDNWYTGFESNDVNLSFLLYF
jgi:GTPase SAR1 family protein